QAKEQRGYDSLKKGMRIPTRALRAPALTIVNYRLNDTNSGLASGNGNGIPENGETIELIAFVRNDGIGPAAQTKVAINAINQGIVIKQGQTTIPKIRPGETVQTKLVFHIPRTFKGTNLQVQLTATDARPGVSIAKQSWPLNFGTRRPVLIANPHIIYPNNNGTFRSGEQGEIEIKLANNGKLEAKNVTLSLQADGIVLFKKRADIGHLAPGAVRTRRFNFQIPRTFNRKTANIKFSWTQKGFPGLVDVVQIPVQPVYPKFILIHELANHSNNTNIRQGETVEVKVRVQNVGGLQAKNVRLIIQPQNGRQFKSGILLNSHSLDQRQVYIGTIPAGGTSDPKTFTIDVQRRAAIGTFSLPFHITQDEFPNQQETLALNVVTEPTSIINLAGDKPSYIPPSYPRTYPNQPPVIALASPIDNQTVLTDSILLQGNVFDETGIANIEVRVNGHLVDLNNRGVGGVMPNLQTTNSKPLPLTAQIPLNGGTNTIIVTALDVDGLSTKQSFTVHRKTGRNEIYGVVIGIDKYPHSHLNYAVNDARAFASYLKTNLGLDQNHLFELYDQQATLTNIKRVLGVDLWRKAKPEDTVLIFFAGHGAPEQDPANPNGDGFAKYLLPVDVDTTSLYSTAFPMDEISNIFQRIRAKRVVFFNDSCFSGASGGRTILMPGIRSGILNNNFLEKLVQGEGRIILTSSGPNQVSRESHTFKHGVFTYYLLRGLRGAADHDGNRIVDIDELSHYVIDNVRQATHGAQIPTRKGESVGQVVVGRY
ncbi:hypothetical protein TI03_02400, partial [Achromatium sp. WMS1]